MFAHNVYLNGRLIDIVFADYSDTDEMRQSLINHDGYNSRIVVRLSHKLSRKGA